MVGDIMKNYIKTNMWEIIMEYLGSMLIVFVLGYIIDLNLFHLFIVDTIIIFIDLLIKYRIYKRDNSEKSI